MADRVSLVVYFQWLDMLQEMPDKAAAFDVLCAVANFVRTGEIHEFSDPMCRMAFSFMRGQAERDAQKYEKTCWERSVAGKRGAAVREANKKRTEANASFDKQTKQMLDFPSKISKQKQIEANQADNEYVKEKENGFESYTTASAPASRKVEKNSDFDSTEMVLYFRQKFEEHFGKPYPIKGPLEEMKILQKFEAEAIIPEVIDEYFGSSQRKGLIGGSDGSIHHFLSPKVLELCKARTGN